MTTLLLVLTTLLATQPTAQPTKWVPFSAELTLHRADGTTAPGRFYQDEHGCERQETPTGPRGTMVVTIQNFEEQKFYQSINGRWTVAPMRLPNGHKMPRVIRGTPLERKLDGFSLVEQRLPSRKPDGTVSEVRHVLVPELNYFLAERPSGLKDQDLIKAHSINVSPPDPSLFAPPVGTELREVAGYSGSMQFVAVELQVRLPGREAFKVETMEMKPATVSMPNGETLFLVTEVLASDSQRVSVKVMRNAVGRPGAVRGDVVETLEIPLGGGLATTKLAENFEIRVVRIGGAIPR
jgi:hypothetical protein